MKVLPLLLLLWLSPVPAAGTSFTLSLPADSVVTIDSTSRLTFSVTNADGGEGLSRLTLRFPSGYRITGGSAPAGWTVEPSSEGGELMFRTEDEGKCTGAIPPGASLVFGVEVTALSSRAVTPDRLVGAEGEQSCRGVAFDPPAALPSWNRLGIEAALAAGPPILGLGGIVTVALTVSNVSTIEVADISALLSPAGTGGVSRVEGPTPPALTLAPGASGSFTWTARAASAGTLAFAGQAVSARVRSAPVSSDPVFVGDLDVSLSVMPEQALSGHDVEVRLTVQNRGPVRLREVTPAPLAFEGTATASAPAGPSPASQPVLEAGESATFTWAVTLTGRPGETYAFSGWAAAEGGSVVSQNVSSNGGVLTQTDVVGEPERTEGGVPLGGGGATGGTAASLPSGGAGGPASASLQLLQLIGVNHDGSQTGGPEFWGGSIRDLRIVVGWANLSGTHTQRLELWTPDGALYQRLTTQFSGASTLETRLPVGGTWITEHSLFGAWRVDVFLDREGMPITSSVFILNP